MIMDLIHGQLNVCGLESCALSKSETIAVNGVSGLGKSRSKRSCRPLLTHVIIWSTSMDPCSKWWTCWENEALSLWRSFRWNAHRLGTGNYRWRSFNNTSTHVMKASWKCNCLLHFSTHYILRPYLILVCVASQTKGQYVRAYVHVNKVTKCNPSTWLCLAMMNDITSVIIVVILWNCYNRTPLSAKRSSVCGVFVTMLTVTLLFSSIDFIPLLMADVRNV